MSIFKMIPACKSYLWGGNKLKTLFDKVSKDDILAETWELSCHKDGESIIKDGPYKGMSLNQYIEQQGKEILGTNCQMFDDFPILIKLIDAKDSLSIQVHPNNEYALKNEGQYGKTEMWYVVEAGEGASLYYGFNQEVTKEEMRRRIEDNTLLEVLNEVKVKPGDVFFIEAGTIHAIGKDIVIAEIQQNSNVTYRVYDYGRVGADGKLRDLHIEKALEVTNLKPNAEGKDFGGHIGACEYFVVDEVSVTETYKGIVTDESFCSILVLDGKGMVSTGQGQIEFSKGDSIFMDAGTGTYEIIGSSSVLITTVGGKAYV